MKRFLWYQFGVVTYTVCSLTLVNLACAVTKGLDINVGLEFINLPPSLLLVLMQCIVFSFAYHLSTKMPD